MCGLVWSGSKAFIFPSVGVSLPADGQWQTRWLVWFVERYRKVRFTSATTAIAYAYLAGNVLTLREQQENVDGQETNSTALKPGPGSALTVNSRFLLSTATEIARK